MPPCRTWPISGAPTSAGYRGWRDETPGRAGEPGRGSAHGAGSAACGEQETQSRFGKEPPSPVPGNRPALGRDKKKCSRPKINKLQLQPALAT